MAFLAILASVPSNQVDEFRAHQRSVLCPSKIVGCSHDIAYLIKEKPLRTLVGDAIDGGEPLDMDLWHPMRVPMYHPADRVLVLSQRLAAVWAAVESSGDRAMRDRCHPTDMGRVVDVYCHAAAAYESVVSALEPPSGSTLVKIPFEYTDEDLFGETD